MEYAGRVLSPSDLAPVVQADCEVCGEDIDLQLIDDLLHLEPCGMDNPEPALLLRNAQIVDGRAIGKEGRHLKWMVQVGPRKFDALWWSPGEKADGFATGQSVDLCIAPEINVWNDVAKVQLVIKAARQSR